MTQAKSGAGMLQLGLVSACVLFSDEVLENQNNLLLVRT